MNQSPGMSTSGSLRGQFRDVFEDEAVTTITGFCVSEEIEAAKAAG